MTKEYKYKEGDKVLIKDSDVRGGHRAVKIVSVVDSELEFGDKTYHYLAEKHFSFIHKSSIVVLNEEDILGKVGNEPGDFKKYLTELRIVASHHNVTYAPSQEEAKAYHKTLAEEWKTTFIAAFEVPEGYAPEIIEVCQLEEIDQ